MKKSIVISLVAMIIATLISGNAVAKTPAKKKTLVVGTNAAYPPFEFVDEKGKIVGFDIDMSTAVAKQAGYDVEIKDMEFTGLIPALVAKQIDVASAGIVPTKERKKIVNFTDSYATEALVIVAKKDSTVTTLKDLEGKTVGAEMGTTSADIAHKIKNAKVVEYDAADIFVNLTGGKVDAIIQTEVVAKYYIKTTKKNNLKVVSENLLDTKTTNQIAFAVNKKNKELLDELEKALAEVKKNGTYDKIYKKWFGK